MISGEKQPFCPICDKFLYDPETEYPHICEKHLIDDDLKRFFEKIVAAITTLLLELEAFEGEGDLGLGDLDEG
jgi:hypothetical protein